MHFIYCFGYLNCTALMILRCAACPQRVHVAQRVIPTQQNNFAHSIKFSYVPRQVATDSAHKLFDPTVYVAYAVPVTNSVSLTCFALFINTLVH